MSEEAASAFLSKLRSDPDMRAKLSEHVSNGAMDSALSFATDQGHSFSKDDLVAAYASDLKSRGYSEEDAQDLSAAAGDGGHYGPPHASKGGGAAYY
jgi:predicted ribosomally synthesized peptide with nif11-like leader